MKFLEKLHDIYESFTIKVSLPIRIGIGVLLFLIIGGSIWGFNRKNNKDEIDPNLKMKQNAYLYEEVIFADEIYMKCIGINANEVEDNFELNLFVKINQWNTDGHINKQEIKSEMFSLKQVDITAPTKMEVFLNNVVKATIAAGVDIVVGGEANVLGSTLGFASDYTMDMIENASTRKYKTIKADKNQFDSFFLIKQTEKQK